jgi:tetratricopeptide (TPR) repeat protein
MRAVIACMLGSCASAPHPGPPRSDVRRDIRDAEAAERQRHHDVARAAYERAVADARDPASAGYAHGHYGETLATWGEYQPALVQLQAAVTAAPDDPAAWHDLGVVREHEGDSSGALAAFEHAVALAQTDWRPRLAIAALRWKLAVRCFKAAAGDCARELDAAKAEYRALQGLEVPDRLRAKIHWALDQLALPRAGMAPAPPAAAAAPPLTP